MQDPSRSISTEHILQNLSACVAIQSGILYYLDNATAILLLRMIVQISFITQRPPAPSNPQIAPVALTTLFNLVYHIFIFSSNPQNTRQYEYAHGGILVDFVGEKGPVSRLKLASIDCLIFLIQLAMLAITYEYGRLQTKTTDNAQDLDSEEQSIRRSQEGQAIELHHLRAGIVEETAVGSHLTDIFYTNYTVIDLDIVTSLRELARSTRTSTAIDPENGAVSSALSAVMERMIHRP
jgi:hypothetical protein